MKALLIASALLLALPAHAYGTKEAEQTVGTWKYCYYSDGSVLKVKHYVFCPFINQ